MPRRACTSKHRWAIDVERHLLWCQGCQALVGLEELTPELWRVVNEAWGSQPALTELDLADWLMLWRRPSKAGVLS